MKFFCIIPPLSRLELADFGSGYFMLAHLANDQEYVKFFNNKERFNKFRILDNGCAERSCVTVPELINTTKLLKPNEVVCPDVLYNIEQTVEQTFQFIEQVHDKNLKVSLMAVPQGETMKQWLDCYKEFLENKFISTIGLSKFSVPKCFKKVTGSDQVGVNRQACVEYLQDNNLLKKPLHLLGMRDPNEYSFYKGNPFIRSTDSCLPVLAGLKGLFFDKTAYREDFVGETPKSYFESVVGDGWANNQLSKVYYNILYLRRIIDETEVN